MPELLHKQDHAPIYQETPALRYPDASNPMSMFDEWYQEAANNHTITEADAVNMATVSDEGLPSNRMVTLRGYDSLGFVFFTNHNSPKGEDLKANAKVALCFYWSTLGKQIRVEGHAHPVNCQEADTLFSALPRENKISAWVSEQSQPLDSPIDLVRDVAHYTERFAGVRVPRPSSWLGFRVFPATMEFWSRGAQGLHNRNYFELDSADRWNRSFLSP